jgi:hypothetical protein
VRQPRAELAAGRRPREELTAAAWRRGGAPDGGSLPKELEAARLKARRNWCSRMAVLRRWPALGLMRKEAGTGMAQARASSVCENSVWGSD